MKNKLNCEKCGRFLSDNHKCPKQGYWKGKKIPEEFRKRMSLGKTKILLKEVLIDLYWDKGYTHKQIGELYNLTRSAIQNYFRIYNIKTRTKSELAKGNKNPMFGKNHSLESNKKHSETYKKRFNENLEFKDNMKKINSKKSLDFWKKMREENPQWLINKNAKVSKILKEKYTNPEERLKQSIYHKKLWQNNDYARLRLEKIGIKPNKKELQLNKILQELYPNEWKYVGDGYTFIAGKNPDFMNVNGQKKLIELFGDYWHKIRKKDDSQERINHFKKYGFDTLIIWESELKEDNYNNLIKKIGDFDER